MSARHRRPMVVGIDDTTSAQFAVRWAVEEAQRRGCPLRVVSAYEVTPPATTPYPVSGRLPRALLQDRFDDAVAYATDRLGRDRVVGRIMRGRPADLLVDESIGAELVVVGSRPRSSLGALAMGSVSGAVAAHADCSVVVAHPRPEPVRLCVVVGVDDSAGSDVALAAAFEAAESRGLAIEVLHCWRPYVYIDQVPFDNELVAEERAKRRHRLTEKVATISEKHPGVRVTTQLIEGGAGHELADRSEVTTLVVVGSRGHGAVSGLLLGSVSQYLLRHARCSVLVAREHGR
jgi:nucleotide-binding universal stress UspA family protein